MSENNNTKTGQPLIDVKGLRVGFGGKEVVHGIDFQIATGEKLALVGDQQTGAVDECHGDEDALALAAGELVGIVAEAALGVGQANLIHGVQHPLPDGTAG